MVSIIEMGIPLPVYLIVTVVAVIVLEMHWIWRFYDNIKNYCPEYTVFKTARQKGIAVIQKWYMSGLFVFELLEKEKKGDMYVKLPDDSHEGIRFDPRIQSKTSKTFTVNSMEVYQYGSNSPYNLSPLNAVAIDCVIEFVRENYKQLNFLNNQIVLEYCSKSKNVLIQDCLNLVVAYNTEESINLNNEQVDKIKEEIRKTKIEILGETADESEIEFAVEKEFIEQVQKTKAENLAMVFLEIQNKLINMPLKPKVFSFADAFQHMTSCLTATDMQTYKQMIDKLSDLKRDRFDMNFLLIVGFAILMILIGAGLFYTITGG